MLGAGYHGGMADQVVEWNLAEFYAAVERGGPPTGDDVTVTRDGRRIDTPEKLIALVIELNELPRPASSAA